MPLRLLPDPGEIGLPSRRVDDYPEPLHAQAIDDEIIDDGDSVFSVQRYVR